VLHHPKDVGYLPQTVDLLEAERCFNHHVPEYLPLDKAKSTLFCFDDAKKYFILPNYI